MNQIPEFPRYNCAKNAADRLLLCIEADKLPLDPLEVLLYGGCRVRTYQEIAASRNLSEDEICRALGSKDGITIYSAKRDTYAVAYNTNRFREERIRWTLAHELGHIALNHFTDFIQSQLIGGTLTDTELSILDKEADAFASELLAPNIILYSRQCFDINAIHDTCRISYQAASIKSNYLSRIERYYLHDIDYRLMEQFHIELKRA